MARWQSGDAADCKSVYAGSIPTRASIFSILSSLRLAGFDAVSGTTPLQGSPCSRWNAQVPLAVPKFLEIPNYSLDRVFCHDDSGSDARVSGTIRA